MKRIFLLSFGIFCFLFIFISKTFAVDTGYPTSGEVQKYALEKNNPVADTIATQKLQLALNQQVTELIGQSRWAPLEEWFGIRVSSLAFTEPADYFYGLSLAYPYLSTTLQTSVRNYLRSHWTLDTPYSALDYSNLNTGTSRNWHPIDQTDFASAVTQGHPIGNRIIQIYPLYLFAQNTGSWDLVGTQYTIIKGIYNNIPTTSSDGRDGNLSRNIASVIGFIRIADHQSQAVDVAAGLTKLSTLLHLKIDQQRTEGTNCLNNMDTANSGQWRSTNCLYSGSIHNGIIQTYYGVVPELGRALRDYSTTSSSNIANWVNRNAQGFYLVRGDTPVQEGEVISPYYITTMSYFHLMSDIQDVDFDRHLQLVDMPASHADPYFIERAVRAIEASSTQSWENYSIAMKGFSPGIPTSTPTATPTQLKAGDVNGDGSINATDLILVLSNYGKTGTGDLNSDGKVNMIDAGIVIKTWGT